MRQVGCGWECAHPAHLEHPEHPAHCAQAHVYSVLVIVSLL